MQSKRRKLLYCLRRLRFERRLRDWTDMLKDYRVGPSKQMVMRLMLAWV